MQDVVCKIPVNGMDLIRTFHAIADAEPDQVLHGRDMTPVLKQPESQDVASEWNKTPTMMTYTRNTYTAERMRMAPSEGLGRGVVPSLVPSMPNCVGPPVSTPPVTA